MIECIAVDDVAASDERWDGPDIGEVSAAEQQSGVRLLEPREVQLEGLVKGMVPADQARGGGPRPVAGQRRRRGSRESGIGSQSQIVIG